MKDAKEDDEEEEDNKKSGWKSKKKEKRGDIFRDCEGEREESYLADEEVKVVAAKGEAELKKYMDNELKEEGKYQEREIEEAKLEAKRRRIEIETEEDDKVDQIL
eukprot:962457-Amorphochlora_amoeboformis.AAC.1